MEKMRNSYTPLHPITQHIRFGLSPLSFGTLRPTVATSYMLGPLAEIAYKIIIRLMIISPKAMGQESITICIGGFQNV